MSKIFYIITLSILTSFIATTVVAEDPLSGLSKLGSKGLQTSADSMSTVGKNLILEKHVAVIYKKFFITCDKATINSETKNITAKGNVLFIQRKISFQDVTMEQFRLLKKNSLKNVLLLGHTTRGTDLQLLKVQISENKTVFKCETLEGNLEYGTFSFTKFKMKANQIYCLGGSATRDPDGRMVVKHATLSTCEYLPEHHEHYAIDSDKIIFEPRRKEWTFVGDDIPVPKGLKGLSKTDLNEFSISAYWAMLRIGNVPVLPLPFFYKPPNSMLWGIRIKAGVKEEWGYFLLLSKKFHLLDSPYIDTEVMTGFFSDRGFGAGAKTTATTRTSKTKMFFYGLRDSNPYGPLNDSSLNDDGLTELEVEKQSSRLDVPRDRYEFSLSHLQHITPRLDFRGQLDKLSDHKFLEDFFPQRDYDDPQPATYAALEYEGDRFSLGLETRVHINSFYSEVEELPTLTLDIPRQELFKNIYYQGKSSVGYYKMNWRDYDDPRIAGNKVDPRDYETFRADSLHMFYYPMKLDWLNINPRAGVRFTYYEKTSKRDISVNNLNTMFIVDSDHGNPPGDVYNYDNDGGGKLRVVGEFGLEVNTKLYRTWGDVKSPYFALDGLRHVMVPYINYTYIPSPTEDRDNLYYFDDIDRINKQNFVRFGVKQRLQTRSGAYGSENIRNWLTLENYYDFHFETEEGFDHTGGLGTKIVFSPSDKLSFSSDLLIDTSGKSNHASSFDRWHGHSSNSGIDSKYIDRLNIGADYKLMEDWNIYLRYNFVNSYKQRDIYSMGSSLAQIMSGTSFNRYYSRSQTITAGTRFPIPIINSDFEFVRDDKTFAEISCDYDVEMGWMRRVSVGVRRKIHCWIVGIDVISEAERDYDDKKINPTTVMASLTLVAMPRVGLKLKQ